jgi:glycosyltransferase involved in cell wall biosynthesis
MKMAFILHAVGGGGAPLSLVINLQKLLDEGLLSPHEFILIHGKQHTPSNKKNDLFFNLKKNIKFYEFKLPFSLVIKGATSTIFTSFYRPLNNFISLIYFLFYYNKILKQENITIVHLNSLVLWPLLLVLPKSMKRVIHIREVPSNTLFSKLAIWCIKKYTTRIVSIDYISNYDFKDCGKSVIIMNPFDMRIARSLKRSSKNMLKLKYDIKPETFIISIIGRIEQVQDYEILLKVADLLKSNNVLFLILGKTNDDYGKKYINLLRQNVNVRYMDELSVLTEIYAITDIVLRLDKIDYIPIGRTLWEGLFSGCIGLLPKKDQYDTSGIDHLVGKNIFFYQESDYTSLYKNIKYLLQKYPDTIYDTDFPYENNVDYSAKKFYDVIRSEF